MGDLAQQFWMFGVGNMLVNPLRLALWLFFVCFICTASSSLGPKVRACDSDILDMTAVQINGLSE